MTEWFASWAVGLLVVVVTLAFHVTGVVLIATGLRRFGLGIVRQHRLALIRHRLLPAILTVSVVGLLLAMLHGMEAGIWAVTYLLVEALPSWNEAVLYSLDSFTTRGASGLTLAAHWRLMGALEAANGTLLFGISTAFLFVVLNRLWQTNAGPME